MAAPAEREPAADRGRHLLARLLFFLVTNFVSWLGQALPYDRGPAGLLESYWMALPFWRGTLASDLVFTARCSACTPS